MRAKNQLIAALQNVVADMGYAWPAKASIEPPKDRKFGDFAANIALVLAKEAHMNPRELAMKVAGALKEKDSDISNIEVAGPGFLNITYAPEFWLKTVTNILTEKERFGSSSVGAGKKVQVEYVSANPTGPLHIGHGRGAAVGDSLARLLRFSGHEVSTEYYTNDAGRQMRILGLSVWVRAKEVAGVPVTLPEDFYRGDYIIDIAKDLLQLEPNLLSLSEEEGKDRCYDYAMNIILNGIKQDLVDFRVGHDVWFSEKSLVDNGHVEATFERLKEAGLAFEEGGALWFRTTQFGDDKDRVLRKSDGTLTYFASDIAYHDNKYQRGFDFVVDVWGADHHGYIPRMRAAVAAIGQPAEAFDVVLIHLVNLLRNGEQIAMSTRAGEFETLADVVKETSADAARFMFLSRKSDSPLDFDLELVKQRTMDNPVYYVQYAHARVCAVMRKAAERGISLPNDMSTSLLSSLTSPEELELIHLLEQFEDYVEGGALALAPHHISYYLMQLAGNMHSYYAKQPILNAADQSLIVPRLALLVAVAQVIRNGLDLLGVSAPELM